MASQQSVLHRSKGTQPQQKQITLIPRPKQNSINEQQEDEVAKEFTSSRNNQQNQRNIKNDQAVVMQEFFQAKHLADVFTTQSVDGSLKKQIKNKTHEGVQKEQARRFLSGNGLGINEKVNDSRQQQASVETEGMNLIMAPNERIVKIKPNNIKVVQQQVSRTQNKNNESNHFSDSGRIGQSLSGFLNNSTEKIQQQLNGSSTSLNSNLNQTKLQTEEPKQKNAVRAKFPAVLHVDPSQGSTSATNNFMLPSHLIIANGPNTYVGSKHTQIGDISSFEKLTLSSQQLVQNYQLLSEEKQQYNQQHNLKQNSKLNSEQSKQKTFMTPQRNTKKVAANRGIIIAHVNARKKSQTNQAAAGQSDSLNTALNNTNSSFNQAKPDKNKALQIYSQYLINQTKTGFHQNEQNYQQQTQNQVIVSPKNSIISGIKKVGGLAVLRASTNSLHSNKTHKNEKQMQVQLNGQSKEKLMIEKGAYQDLMNYLVKAESKRIESEKRNESQPLNSFAGMNVSSFTNSKLSGKQNSQTGQQQIKLQSTQQQKNSEIQILQSTQHQQLQQAIQKSQASPTKQQIQLKTSNLPKQIQMPNGTISSNFSRHSIQIRANQQNNSKVNINQNSIIKLRTSTSKDPQGNDDQERETSLSSLKFQKQTPKKIPAKAIKSRNIMNAQTLQTIGGTLPMPLTSNNLMIKQFANIQRSDANESDVQCNGQNRYSLEFINILNASNDNSLKTGSSFVALKNNFIDELSGSKRKKHENVQIEQNHHDLMEYQQREFKLKQKFSQGSNGIQKVNEGKKKTLFKQKNSSNKLKNLQLKPQPLNGQENIITTKSTSVKYKDLIKKVPTQGGIINAAIAQEVLKNSEVSESIGDNYAVLRNSSRTRASASLPRKSREESSLNISSPKNIESSLKCGRMRTKSNKSGTESSINPQTSLRNKKSHVAVSKIIKLNRKVLKENGATLNRRSYIDGVVSQSCSSVENIPEISNICKSFENVGNSSDHVHPADKIKNRDIIQAGTRYLEQPHKIKLAKELLTSADDIANKLKKNLPKKEDFFDEDPMIGGNFNTFGEHAPNLFTQTSDDDDVLTEIKPKLKDHKLRLAKTKQKPQEKRKPLEAIHILQLSKRSLEVSTKKDLTVLQTPKLATEITQTQEVIAHLNSIYSDIEEKVLHQGVLGHNQSKNIEYYNENSQKSYNDAKGPEFHYSGSFGVPDSPVVDLTLQLQVQKVVRDQKDSLVEQLQSFDYSVKETQIFNPDVIVSDYSDSSKPLKQSRGKAEFQLVNMSFSQQSIHNEDKLTQNLNKMSIQIVGQTENKEKEKKGSLNIKEILATSKEQTILQQNQNTDQQKHKQDKISDISPSQISNLSKSKYIKEKNLAGNAPNAWCVEDQLLINKNECNSDNDRYLGSEQRRKLVVSKSAIQLLQTINHSLGIQHESKIDEVIDNMNSKPDIAVKLLKGMKSPNELGSSDFEFPLADQDETNTVVENECDNDYNYILDEENESVTLDFAAQNSIKIISPVSETKANHLNSVEIALSQNESSSINSKTLAGQKGGFGATELNSVQYSQDVSFLSSRKNSNSEQVLSSRVDRIASGQVSGRISNHMMYSPVSEEESDDCNEIYNRESSLRNSSQKDNGPESQLFRYCLEKDVAIRNFNSKQEAKKRILNVQAQTEELESSEIEEFENLPEFEQSFQTMRADDEAVESYGDEHGIFFHNTMFLQSQQTDGDQQQYQTEFIEDGEKIDHQHQDSFMRFASHGQNKVQDLANKVKLKTNQTTKKVSETSNVNHNIQIVDQNMVSADKNEIDMFGQPNFDFIESSGKHEELAFLQKSERKENSIDETDDKYQFVRNLNKQFQSLLK